jgi:hypothetical protein
MIPGSTAFARALVHESPPRMFASSSAGAKKGNFPPMADNELNQEPAGEEAGEGCATAVALELSDREPPESATTSMLASDGEEFSQPSLSIAQFARLVQKGRIGLEHSPQEIGRGQYQMDLLSGFSSDIYGTWKFRIGSLSSCRLVQSGICSHT